MKKSSLFLALAASLAILTAPAAFARGGGHSGGHSRGSHSSSHYSSYHCCSRRSSDVHVRSYTRRNGTYVHPHMRSHEDSTKLNNFSTQGNINPYTGQVGTKSPY